jgi:hypothetical protein
MTKALDYFNEENQKEINLSRDIRSGVLEELAALESVGKSDYRDIAIMKLHEAVMWLKADIEKRSTQFIDSQ